MVLVSFVLDESHCGHQSLITTLHHLKKKEVTTAAPLLLLPTPRRNWSLMNWIKSYFKCLNWDMRANLSMNNKTIYECNMWCEATKGSLMKVFVFLSHNRLNVCECAGVHSLFFSYISFLSLAALPVDAACCQLLLWPSGNEAGN